MSVKISEMDCAQGHCKYYIFFRYFKVFPSTFWGDNNYILRALLLCQERKLQLVAILKTFSPSSSLHVSGNLLWLMVTYLLFSKDKQDRN